MEDITKWAEDGGRAFASKRGNRPIVFHVLSPVAPVAAKPIAMK